MAAPLRLIVADDHALFRQGLRSMRVRDPARDHAHRRSPLGAVRPGVVRKHPDRQVSRPVFVSRQLGYANAAITLKVYAHFVEDKKNDVQELASIILS